ncbi:hypothetical protein BGZ74_000436 [Mortierella antarctica]|nr:hypothetical protein BGZ74_000436 [Mortierella antarctica]
MTTPLKLIRPIDNLERYNVTRSNVNIYNNVIIGNRIHSSLPNTPTTTQQWVRLLHTPLAQLFDQHVLLTVVVGSHLSAKPVFLRLPAIDISSTVRTLTIPTPNDIGAVLEDEHNMPFDLSSQTDPLWRIVIAQIENDQSFYLLFSFHHVIADGRSAMSLTEQLIRLLNSSQGSSEETSSIIPITSTKSIPDAIETRIDCSPSLRTLLYEVTRAIFLPGFMKKALETRYWAGEIDSSLDCPNETQLRYLQLSKAETSQVVAAAKAHRTTVQALLYTASVFATKSVFMSRDDRIGQEENMSEALVFATPVSLRGLIPDPIAPEDMGNYTSEILHDVCVAHESSYWEMTSAYRKQVVHGTTTPRGLQDLLEHFGMLKFLSTKDGGWEEFMKSKVSKDQHGRKASIKLSNLGRGWDSVVEKGDENRAFTVVDGVFSQSSGVTASALTMSAATANGVLTVATTWQKAGFRGRERADLFVKEFKRILFEAIEPTRQEYLFRDALQGRY